MNISMRDIFINGVHDHPYNTRSKHRKRKNDDGVEDVNGVPVSEQAKKILKPSLELPGEILYKVFKRCIDEETNWKDIGRLAMTCKQFFLIVTSPKIIRKFLAQRPVTELGLTGRLTAKIANFYCQRVPKLTIHLDNKSKPRFSHLSRLGNCQELYSLYLSSEYVDDKQFIKATRRMPNLRKFTNQYCKLTPWGLFQLVDHCTQLTKLVWKGDTSIPQNVVVNLSEKCKGLQKFSCKMGEITEDELMLIASSCTRLHTLKVSQMDEAITDRGIEEIAKRCTGLRTLHLTSPGNYSDKTFQSLGRYCTNLTSLKLKEAETTATDPALIFFTNRCTRLKNLYLQWNAPVITDIAAIALSKNCPQMVCLQLSNTLIHTGSLDLAKKSLNLRHLSLYGSPINDDILTELAQYFGERLESIDLSSCPNINSAGVKKLVSCCPNLQLINLLRCPNIHFNALEDIFKIPSKVLKIFNLSYCPGVTKQLVEQYKAAYPKIYIVTQV